MKEMTLESQANFKAESYSEMFWRHGKQLLKGAAVLGAGMLGFGALRYFRSETSVTDDTRISKRIDETVMLPESASAILRLDRVVY